MASLVAVALTGIRNGQILREKADCKQSKTIKGKIIETQTNAKATWSKSSEVKPDLRVDKISNIKKS